jgi:ATP-binding cassette, subfamily B, bacterial HlyB/CyaB
MGAPIPGLNFVWAIGSICALHRKAFEPELLVRQFPPPHSGESLVRAAGALGFKTKRLAVVKPAQLLSLPSPYLAELAESERAATDKDDRASLCVVAERRGDQLVVFEPDTNSGKLYPAADFAKRLTGAVYIFSPAAERPEDPDAPDGPGRFGFGWFFTALLKHKRVWRDVLIASLFIQILALGVPLFTQIIIDKVLVHQTESTLLVIGTALAVFILFSAALTWVRQYLVLHAGNQVDAVLGSSVFEHLFKLPPRYFQHRPTGVIAARLHGVETIREFVASAAVTLILDMPFLLIFLAIMLYYSVPLTLIALGALVVIAILSAAMAPVFQSRLNDQFLLGARNQAYVTEYVSGMETVKSLQLEPTVQDRYHGYLADFLRAGFRTKQIGNSYSVAANTLEQLMTLGILIAGAYLVMSGTDFTIGMLVAFQMLAGKLSQPVLRLVGLWQQLQQASLSVKRLGDIMNAPTEPYSIVPARPANRKGAVEIADLAFSYGEKYPLLFERFSLQLRPGSIIAVMGPSGSGKSTLAKLLQGFYEPTHGYIRIDGVDIGNMSANELRAYFGVVPQETVLFSGTIHDNLGMANRSATFEQIVEACRMAEVHEVIEKLPKGYLTQIGERGAGLSGGQKQRIAIARALLKRPRILIFDEATSNLDSATAEQFAKTVNRLRGKATMLFISHALPATLHVDEVVRIGEKGSLRVVGGSGESTKVSELP